MIDVLVSSRANVLSSASVDVSGSRGVSFLVSAPGRQV